VEQSSKPAEQFERTRPEMCLLCQDVLDGGKTNLQSGFSAYQSGDYETAYALLIPFAQAGAPVALCLVGSMKHLGFGTPPDYKQAADYYQRAGQKGCALSFNNLATMYAIGLVDGKPNTAEAKKYLAKAITLGFDLVQEDFYDKLERGNSTDKKYRT
jgi:TPR repeat protein